jgi:glutaredoxin
MLLKAFRTSMGSLMVFLNWITQPKPQSRSLCAQNKVQESVLGHSLYQHNGCPFCVKTRRAMRRLNLEFELRDIGKNQQFRDQLETGGGRVKVPCLRVEQEGSVNWLYNSKEIISYLENRAAGAVEA